VAVTLLHACRSAAPSLRLLDNCLSGATEAGFAPEQPHLAFHEAMPGRVDLWPLVEKSTDEEDGAWYDPVDRVGTTHHTVTLAGRIAHFIRETIRSGTALPDAKGARPVHAGDFLILVRGRSRLFEEIIRACKPAGLPIAGADRLKVMAELAVRDIIALLQFLATAEDDLSLAVALRSPLFALSEQDLFSLAHGRGKQTLWQVLRGSDRFPQALGMLHDLRNQADFLRPYDLIDRILTRHLGRRLLLGRLGAEAEDGINALLAQALSYEQTEVPSLTGFLQWAQSDDLQIKRAPDAAGRQLRVMTVHGSKGLEAPIVILPDCAQPDTKLRGSLLRDDHGVLWKTRADQMPPRQVAAAEAAKAAEARERDRLLYVALTRAEKWLVVAAHDDLGKDGASWFEKVQRGMDRSAALPHVFDFGTWGTGEGLRLAGGEWPAPVAPDAPGEASKPDLPGYATSAALVPDRPAGTVSPSKLGGAKALAGAGGDTEELAMARGTAMHALLEHMAPLSPETRPDAARSFLSQMDDPLLQDHLETIRTEALSVLDSPELAWMFAPDTLAEVPVSADLPGIGRIHGTIDRLSVTAQRVAALDFKSNRVLPERPEETPEALLRQMAAYRDVLRQIYPDKTVVAGIVWTRDTSLMWLPDDLLTAALARATAS